MKISRKRVLVRTKIMHDIFLPFKNVEPVHSLNVFEWQKDIIHSPYSHQNMFSTNLNKCLISLQILVPFGRRPLEMVCGSDIKTDKLAIDRA